MRIKISRKESKESRYWLRLVDVGDGAELERERAELVQEATELMNIFRLARASGSERLRYSDFRFSAMWGSVASMESRERCGS
jgi:hypothetical protein